MVLKKVLYVYLCYFSDLSIRNSLLAGVAGQKIYSEKNSECKRCKALTGSFNHWLDKTSRGKYEGGDAAWEEAKLKSYSRSEIRFVEVQEGLCSEVSKHQHDCYMLAEEAEQMLEQWWFHEDPSASDLQTWLCIETLKRCCPNKHFGESCSPCPLDTDNKICNGHGRCDGDGTRNGNGSCICDKGYRGPFCGECAENYYDVDGSCESCDLACAGCTSAGPASCIKCKHGWVDESGVCVDIDECLSSSICKSNQYCINKEGSFRCQKCDDSCKSCMGSGPFNCTSCEPNQFNLWNGTCIADSLRAEIVKSATKRMTIYIGLLLMLGILYKIAKRLSVIVFILLVLFIFYTEKSLNHASTYNVYFNNLGRKLGTWSF